MIEGEAVCPGENSLQLDCNIWTADSVTTFMRKNNGCFRDVGLVLIFSLTSRFLKLRCPDGGLEDMGAN